MKFPIFESMLICMEKFMELSQLNVDKISHMDIFREIDSSIGEPHILICEYSPNRFGNPLRILSKIFLLKIWKILMQNSNISYSLYRKCSRRFPTTTQKRHKISYVTILIHDMHLNPFSVIKMQIY